MEQRPLEERAHSALLRWAGPCKVSPSSSAVNCSVGPPSTVDFSKKEKKEKKPQKDKKNSDFKKFTVFLKKCSPNWKKVHQFWKMFIEIEKFYQIWTKCHLIFFKKIQLFPKKVHWILNKVHQFVKNFTENEKSSLCLRNVRSFLEK